MVYEGKIIIKGGSLRSFYDLTQLSDVLIVAKDNSLVGLLVLKGG